MFVLGFPFLYFPEDKTEYIPALITLVIFSIFAYLAFHLFKKVSKIQEQKVKDLEARMKKSVDSKTR